MSGVLRAYCCSATSISDRCVGMLRGSVGSERAESGKLVTYRLSLSSIDTNGLW
jgi:hypothetical protein